MELYKAPEILVVHFKRFSHTRQSMFGSRKLNMQIDFPVEGLDLSSFMMQTQEDSLKPTSSSLYDLYAISNHYGSLNGGHYTAMCSNPLSGNWYEFDDSQVSRLSSKD